MELSIVTAKGQVVIPVRIRRKHGIKSGTLIRFVEEGNKIILEPLTPEFVDSQFGFLGTKGKLLQALMEEKKREREP